MQYITDILSFFQNLGDVILAFDYLGFMGDLLSLLTFELFLKIVVIYFFIVWIALIVWVMKDIVNRTNNIIYQFLALSTVIVGTPLGIVIYLLIRPSKTLFEKYYEEATLDDQEVEKFLEENKEKKEFCETCFYEIQPDFHFCPNCMTSLKKVCSGCEFSLKNSWKMCPFCGEKQEQENETKKSQSSQKRDGEKKEKKQKQKDIVSRDTDSIKKSGEQENTQEKIEKVQKVREEKVQKILQENNQDKEKKEEKK